jgi:elongation factor Ts
VTSVAEISADTVKKLRDATGAGMMDCKRALEEAGGDATKAGAILRERGLAKAVKREGRATSEGVIALALSGKSGAILELACETDFVARTPNFVALAEGLAAAAAADAKLNNAAALLAAKLGGETVENAIKSAVGKIGENIQLKRVERIEVSSGHVGGYVHAGGKLGVLVALDAPAGGAGLDALAKDVAMHVAAHDPTPVAVDKDGVSAELLEGERAIYRKQAEGSGKPPQVIEKIVEGKIAKFLSEVCLVKQGFVKDPDKTIGKLLDEAGKGVKIAGFRRFKLGEGAPA